MGKFGGKQKLGFRRVGHGSGLFLKELRRDTSK